jgi:hypothetical protein
MNAREPGLQVREDEMDNGQKLFGDFRIAAFGDRVVIIFGQSVFPESMGAVRGSF